MHAFIFTQIMLCCIFDLLATYAQYYVQEQELLSNYYAIYIQICLKNSLHVAS